MKTRIRKRTWLGLLSAGLVMSGSSGICAQETVSARESVDAVVQEKGDTSQKDAKKKEGEKVIIDTDSLDEGESDVIDLRAPDSMQELRANALKMIAQQKYKIGVACAPNLIDDSSGDETTPGGEIRGLRVVGVYRESPAEKAKIEADDIILSIDGVPLESIDQLVAGVQKAGENGTEMAMEIDRNGERIEAKVKPADNTSNVQALIDRLSTPPGWIMGPAGPGGRKYSFPFPAQPGQPVPGLPNPQIEVFSTPWGDSIITEIVSLKKEVESLRKEISELKELVGELRK